MLAISEYLTLVKSTTVVGLSVINAAVIHRQVVSYTVVVLAYRTDRVGVGCVGLHDLIDLLYVIPCDKYNPIG
jgi:hypothetical protein